MFSRAGDCYHAESSSDEERDERDSAYIAAAVTAARAAAAVAHPAARASRGRRHGLTEHRVGREDMTREVPIGFARWESPTIDPAGFTWGSLGGWRVAVPTYPGPDPGGLKTRARVAAVYARLSAGGPAAAGYVRVGDTLVPATLTPGERATLAYSAARPDSPPPADMRY